MDGPGRKLGLTGVPRRLWHQNLSIARNHRLHRILELAGHELHLGLPGPGDGVLVWGRSPTAWRGERLAARRGCPLIRVEDAFLRSIHPGRLGEAPLGLLIDPVGVHFDSAAPSRLEQLLAEDLQNSNLLLRASQLIERIRHLHLSKYNNFDIALPVPEPGFVLVVDQTRGDASIRHSGAKASDFAALLDAACRDYPDRRILIRTHPETSARLRPGHFGPQDAGGRVTLFTDPVSPHALLAGAAAVYTVSSQMGFEAILHGHRPHVLGQPFYAGWGLTQDARPLPRRTARLTAEQLFAGAMILAPLWYDPCRDRLCEVEDVIDQLEAETRAFREDRRGHVAAGMRLWKRPHLQHFFGPLRFRDDPVAADRLAATSGRGLLIWAGKEPPGFQPKAPCLRVEDGFLRSRGLGADLVPPLSLVTDDRGIYYDPSRPSRLDDILSRPMPPGGEVRAAALIGRLRAGGFSKYNLPAPPLPPLPPGHRILVPGQVEDDASILRGAGAVRTNLDLLRAVREANPSAVVIYKPHPDVVAGLRAGGMDGGLADLVIERADPAALLGAVAEVWTMTSLLGFEALVRGVPVTCLGAPFYAGRGLTRDLGAVPGWRDKVSLERLVHAALVEYPRYWDPVSKRACPVEVVLDRLESGQGLGAGAVNRGLAKLQGWLAGWAWLWR
ncbi:capsular polysaccharide biosynthesis protein [Tabrizicola aquatica]|uniref:capsular polysaccharide biosynthesis protein n=1 Tax=Tabrizicola aquatica TaxID=909926 RepID=UPI003CCC3E43